MATKDKLREIESLQEEVDKISNKRVEVSLTNEQVDLLAQANKEWKEIKDRQNKLDSLMKKNGMVMNRDANTVEFSSDFGIKEMAALLNSQFGYSTDNTYSSYNNSDILTLSQLLCKAVSENNVSRISEEFEDEGHKKSHFDDLQSVFGKIGFVETHYFKEPNDYDIDARWDVYVGGQFKFELTYWYESRDWFVQSEVRYK